ERLGLERRLRETEKMAAIGNLAAGLAHEIAAPLNVISGRAELMLKSPTDPTHPDRHLRIIVRQINRITTIVRNLLDCAKRREPRMRDVDLADVLDGAIALLDTELAKSEVALTREESRPLAVRGDADLLHQLFVNLILNAVQSMDR